MDIDAAFESLGLPSDKKSLVWEGRARIIWGTPADEVQTWLTDQGIDSLTAREIVAIALRERALAIRALGVKDLILGVLAGGTGAGIAIGAGLIMNLVFDVKVGQFAVHRGLGALLLAAGLAFIYGVYRTARGLERILFGARVGGSVSDLDG
jgi:hypothetical protein